MTTRVPNSTDSSCYKT